MTLRVEIRSPVAVILAMGLALAACGGGGAPSAGPASPAAGGSSPAPAAPVSEAPAPTAAVGGSGSTSGEAGPVDACALLDDAEVEAATGRSVMARQPKPAFGDVINGCELTLEQGSDIVEPSILLGVYTPGGQAYFEAFFAPFAEENGQEPVAGVGDAAFIGDVGDLLAVKGDAFLTLQYLSDAGATPEELQAIASGVVNSLP